MTLFEEITESVNTKGAANTTWAYRGNLVSEEVIATGRWDERILAVIERDLESVGIEYSTGLTEYQDSTEEEPEVYYVRPVPTTVIKWIKS